VTETTREVRAATWDAEMQKDIWRMRNLGWNAAKIAAQFEGVSKGVMRYFIQSGRRIIALTSDREQIAPYAARWALDVHQHPSSETDA
jgi:hypothetical protein